MVFMKMYFTVGSRFEEFWEYVKLMKTIGIILLVPIMFAFDAQTQPYTVTLGVLSLIGTVRGIMHLVYDLLSIEHTRISRKC